MSIYSRLAIKEKLRSAKPRKRMLARIKNKTRIIIKEKKDQRNQLMPISNESTNFAKAIKKYIL